ncbi:hypothetical protein N2152v2_002858 [Parachlorella kessleri]
MGKHSDTLKRLFDQWQGGKNDNLEEYMKLLSEDIEYDHFLHPTLAQEAGIFYLTHKKGKEAVRQMHQRLQGPKASVPAAEPAVGMAFERYKILRWYESEDTVFLLVDIKALVHDTGKTYEDQHLLEYVFNEEGKVCRFRHWLDTGKHIESNSKDYINT